MTAVTFKFINRGFAAGFLLPTIWYSFPTRRLSVTWLCFEGRLVFGDHE